MELERGTYGADRVPGWIRRALQIVVLLCPALTVVVKGGANGSLFLASALSLAALLVGGRTESSGVVAAPTALVRAYAFAMAAPVVVLAMIQTLHGMSLAVGAIGSAARLLLAVPIVLVLWRMGGILVRWADVSFALGAVATAAVMVLAPREWSHGRWSSSFLDPINFGGLALLLGVLSLLSVDWYRHDPRLIRALKVAGFVAAFCAAVPTGARGPWMALFVLVPILALATLRRRAFAVRMAVWGSVTAALLVALVTVDALQGRFDLMATDLSSFFRGGERDTSPGIRLQIWQAAWMAFTERPLLGLGGGGFASATESYARLGILSPAAAEAARAEVHNSYLAYAADFGILGLLAIIAVFAVPGAAFARRLDADAVGSRAALMGLTVVVMYASCAITVDVFALKMMAAFYACATAFLAAIAFSSVQAGAQPDVGSAADPAAQRN